MSAPRVVVVLLTLAAVAGPPSAAQALGVDATGAVTAQYVDAGRPALATAAADEDFRVIQPLAPGVAGADAAVTAAGELLVAIEPLTPRGELGGVTSDGVYVDEVAPGSRLTRPQNYLRGRAPLGGAYGVRLFANRRGDAVLLTRGQYTTRVAGGLFGRTGGSILRRLEALPGLVPASVAVDGRGGIIAYGTDPDTGDAVVAEGTVADGFTSRRVVDGRDAGSGGRAGYVAGGDGGAHVVLDREAGALVATVRLADGTLLAPQRIDAAPDATPAGAGIDARGVVTVLWTEGPDRAASLRIAVSDPDGRFTTSQLLVDGLEVRPPAQLAVNAAGAAVIAYVSTSGDGSGRGSVRAQLRTRDGRYGEAIGLPVDIGDRPSLAAVAIGESDLAAVQFGEDDEQIARLDATGRPSIATLPAAGARRLPVPTLSPVGGVGAPGQFCPRPFEVRRAVRTFAADGVRGTLTMPDPVSANLVAIGDATAALTVEAGADQVVRTVASVPQADFSALLPHQAASAFDVASLVGGPLYLGHYAVQAQISTRAGTTVTASVPFTVTSCLPASATFSKLSGGGIRLVAGGGGGGTSRVVVRRTGGTRPDLRRAPEGANLGTVRIAGHTARLRRPAGAGRTGVLGLGTLPGELRVGEPAGGSVLLDLRRLKRGGNAVTLRLTAAGARVVGLHTPCRSPASVTVYGRHGARRRLKGAVGPPCA